MKTGAPPPPPRAAKKARGIPPPPPAKSARGIPPPPTTKSARGLPPPPPTKKGIPLAFGANKLKLPGPPPPPTPDSVAQGLIKQLKDEKEQKKKIKKMEKKMKKDAKKAKKAKKKAMKNAKQLDTISEQSSDSDEEALQKALGNFSPMKQKRAPVPPKNPILLGKVPNKPAPPPLPPKPAPPPLPPKQNRKDSLETPKPLVNKERGSSGPGGNRNSWVVSRDNKGTLTKKKGFLASAKAFFLPKGKTEGEGKEEKASEKNSSATVKKKPQKESAEKTTETKEIPAPSSSTNTDSIGMGVSNHLQWAKIAAKNREKKLNDNANTNAKVVKRNKNRKKEVPKPKTPIKNDPHRKTRRKSVSSLDINAVKTIVENENLSNEERFMKQNRQWQDLEVKTAKNKMLDQFIKKTEADLLKSLTPFLESQAAKMMFSAKPKITPGGGLPQHTGLCNYFQMQVKELEDSYEEMKSLYKKVDEETADIVEACMKVHLGSVEKAYKTEKEVYSAISYNMIFPDFQGIIEEGHGFNAFDFIDPAEDRLFDQQSDSSLMNRLQEYKATSESPSPPPPPPPPRPHNDLDSAMKRLELPKRSENDSKMEAIINDELALNAYCNEFFALVDEDQSNTISMIEFVKLVNSKSKKFHRHHKVNILDYFRQIDEDDSGEIDVTELALYLKKHRDIHMLKIIMDLVAAY
jgi:hypothetical protein